MSLYDTHLRKETIMQFVITILAILFAIQQVRKLMIQLAMKK